VLNCTYLHPTIGLAKRFKKAQRKTFEINADFNAAVDRVTQLAQMIVAEPDAQRLLDLKRDKGQLLESLDTLDAQAFESLLTQAKMVLKPHTFTPGDDSVLEQAPAPSLDLVAWDELGIPELKESIGFFGTLIAT
jgi:hypothetical protein